MADTPKNRRSIEALATLLPSGVMGLSIALAAADAAAATTEAPAQDKSVATRLEALRGSVADAWKEAMEKSEPYVGVDPETKLAWWGNGWRGGWRNGGWHNGGWHNGGWHNGGWGNGWHNGGWGNGWHNGGWGNGGWGNGGIVGGILGGIFGSPWGNGFRNW
jgi:rSAM-associated Gly-rich repeat protein